MKKICKKCNAVLLPLPSFLLLWLNNFISDFLQFLRLIDMLNRQESPNLVFSKEGILQFLVESGYPTLNIWHMTLMKYIAKLLFNFERIITFPKTTAFNYVYIFSCFAYAVLQLLLFFFKWLSFMSYLMFEILNSEFNSKLLHAYIL